MFKGPLDDDWVPIIAMLVAVVGLFILVMLLMR